MKHSGLVHHNGYQPIFFRIFIAYSFVVCQKVCTFVADKKKAYQIV